VRWATWRVDRVPIPSFGRRHPVLPLISGQKKDASIEKKRFAVDYQRIGDINLPLFNTTTIHSLAAVDFTLEIKCQIS